MVRPKIDDVIKRYEAELAELQPAIDALATVPALQDAVRAAVAAEREYRDSPQRPQYSSVADRHAIELNGTTNQAEARLRTVADEGRDAERRAIQIRAKLAAPGEVAKLKAQAESLRKDHLAARQKAERSSALAGAIADEISDLESERVAAIDRGIEDRLDGKPDASSPTVARVDSELVIKRGALAGAERAATAATNAVQRIPSELAEIAHQLRNAVALRGDLEWEQFKAASGAAAAAARYLAAKAMGFSGADVAEIRPPRAMVDAAIAELEAEIRAVAINAELEGEQA